MPTTTISGTAVDTNDEGFFTDPDQWSEAMAPELAAAAVSVVSGPRRDEAWAWLDRARGTRAVALWSDAVRRLPDSHVAAPAAVLAFAAWLAGDGALAWCAVDRCRDVEPGHSLAHLVAGLLLLRVDAVDIGKPAVCRP